MGHYLNIAKINLKFNLLPHILAALAFCLFAPVIMGIENLDTIQTAQVLEVYIALIGIVLLIPIFLPDQNKDIRDLTESKKMPVYIVHLIRLIEAIVILALFILGIVFILKQKGCEFPILQFFAGIMAEAVFLGSLGILAYSFSDTLPVAYMVPLLYYIICYGGGKKYLGQFYLFSMINGSYTEKWYLFIGGVICIGIGIFYRSKRWR